MIFFKFISIYNLFYKTKLKGANVITMDNILNKSKTKFIILITPYICSAMILILLSFNYAFYTIQKTFCVLGYNLIFSKGFLIEGNIVYINLLTRLGMGGCLFFAILGLIFFIFKKYVFASLSYIIVCICPFIAILGDSLMDVSKVDVGLKIQVTYMFPIAFILLFGFIGALVSVLVIGVEALATCVFKSLAFVSVIAVFTIMLYVVISGAPAISKIGIVNFLFYDNWKPSLNQYGILAMICSSVVATFGAVIIGVPIGIFTAIFLTDFAGKGISNIIRTSVQLLAGIPSVVYGFFGMLVIVQSIKKIVPNQKVGDSLLAVIIILSIMILPTVVTVSENSIKAVPNYYREAALALGTTPTQTIFRVVIPAAKNGILSGVILGIGRAIGETMAVIMVAGNVVNMPSLLGTVRLLTTGIVLEMSYSSGLHRQALFAISLVLFVFIIIINMLFSFISRKGVIKD